MACRLFTLSYPRSRNTFESQSVDTRATGGATRATSVIASRPTRSSQASPSMMSSGRRFTARPTTIKILGPRRCLTRFFLRTEVPSSPSLAIQERSVPFCEVSRMSTSQWWDNSNLPLLIVVGHQEFGLNTGAAIPVLLKAQIIGGNAPTTAFEPFTPLCTCTSPPPMTATTSVCSYPTSA